MKIDILTIFPEMFEGPFEHSIIERAQEAGMVEIEIHDLRNWAKGKHKKVDDTPYGGGGGMVMMVEPIHKAIEELKQEGSIVVATTAKGQTLKQSTVKGFSSYEHIILICGHYEGFDQRILDELVDYPISIGNYILTGGEIPAMVIVDSVVRLLPGAVGNEETPKTDSFYNDDQTKQHPIYSKPAEYDLDGKSLKVPEVLLSGDHERIIKWKDSSNS
ncbi:tRNA (guanosine(37)-N1)-methyltransferase TrmD [Candidatus Dojkabacteria bacterium]|nr:tRNA (guanosine(37)-N1)-methyltransferase TrmD [Candidatus Dojkabacteria bacterium]